jgi:hypothetical protein
MALKKNISIYMPFIFKNPNKNSQILDKFKTRSFLYKNSFNISINKIYNNININFIFPKKL